MKRSIRGILFLAVVTFVGFAIWPNIQSLRRYSAESVTRGAHGTLRLKIEEYKKAHGRYPNDLTPFAPLPTLKLFDTPHKPSAGIRYGKVTDISDTGEWLYDNGKLLIDCTHPDSRGTPWSSN